MSKILDNLLTLAHSQVGYTEKDNDKDLDTKVGTTAGSGNHTKYARDLTAIGLPGYCGSAWCAVYQMWLDVQTVGKDQALKNMGPQFYNCFAIRDYAKAAGRWLDWGATPKPGYLVIFRQSHVGRVTRVADSRIYTNEGNTSNGTAVVRNGGMVCDKSYALSDGSILGYVKMEYPDQPSYDQGWHHDSNGWWYADTPQSYHKSCWQIINGHKYYFNPDGYAVTNWHQISGKWYYFEPVAGHPLECALYVTDADGVQGPGEF